MAAITYDGQSFMVDGRRIWLVSGTIHYARVPRAQWAARIHAAKQAGLNTIDVPVIWARHEPRQAQFDFTGENDLRHFVQLIHQAGMMCILRPGPYIGLSGATGWDLGGLPPWVLSVPNIRLRTASQPFLEACSRYITAVAQQVRDLQVTSPGAAGGGPIVLIQNESSWTCGDDQLAAQYLGELNRYYREAGLTVPTLNANDLWQGVEGEIDSWTGFDNLLAFLRQLSAVRPDQPRVVIDLKLGECGVWGRPSPACATSGQVLHRMVEVMAAGGQFNLSPFHGGTNFGFSGGRDGSALDAFYATSHSCGSPLAELGGPGPTLGVVKRACLFASRFARVLANLEPARTGVIQHPSMPATAGASPSVVYATGVHGSVAFIFGDETGASQAQSVNLLLPDGTTLPVNLGAEAAGWCLFDTRLTGRTTLDYTNLCALAVVGKVLVCYGPAGSRGLVSINGSRLEVDVPGGVGGREPVVMQHEGITVVICSIEQVDAVCVDDEMVYVGVSGLTTPHAGAPAHPLPHPGYKTYTKINAAGESSVHRAVPPPAPRVVVPAPAPPVSTSKKKGSARSVQVAHVEPPPGPPLTLSSWTTASALDYADGTSARYASIPGPADLDSLGAPYGYGWYRLKLKTPPAGKHRVLFPMAGDRLHLTLDGEAAGVVGFGPGAEAEGKLQFKQGPHTLVVLAENAGRFSSGLNLTQRVGMYGHAWTVSAFRAPAAKLQTGEPLDPLAFVAPQWGVHRGDATDPERLTWAFSHKRRTPLFFRMRGGGLRGLLLLNGAPIHAFDGAGISCVTIEVGAMARASAMLQLALLGPPGVAATHAKELAQLAEFFEGEECLTDPGPAAKAGGGRGSKADRKVEWGFAKWEPPAADAFEAAPKPGARMGTAPRWWKCVFGPDESGLPLLLDLSGMTKGQMYINGRHLGRYFVATARGEGVGPQGMYHVPRSYMDRAGCELMLFDEHGASPARVRLIAPAIG